MRSFKILAAVTVGLFLLSGSALAQTEWPAGSGHFWTISDSDGGRANPGQNVWCVESARFENNGIYLTSERRGGTWCAAEVQNVELLGYGEYRFCVVADPYAFDLNTVFGAFFFAIHQGVVAEAAIEITKVWSASAPGTPEVYYVVQPNNSHSFYLSQDGWPTETCHRITWSARSVLFESWAGNAEETADATRLGQWEYVGDNVPPQAAEPVWLFNLWRAPVGSDPTKADEVIITDFSFTPLN